MGRWKTKLSQKVRLEIKDARDNIVSMVNNLESKNHLKSGDVIIPSVNINSSSNPNFRFDENDWMEAHGNPKIIILEKQMEKVVTEITMREEEVGYITASIIQDLKSALENPDVPKHEWKYYGSYANGLACKDSDIDFYYPLKGNDVEKKMAKIVSLLRKSPSFKKVKLIRANVTIIKLVHVSTNKECDISFNEIGIWSSKLTKVYLTFNPNLKILTLYLRHLLEKYDLHGTNKITTHTLFWLVVYFMQQRELLPSVMNVCKSVEGENLVPNQYPFYSCTGSLYLLLMDFFKFYREFDFLKYVISPYLGHTIPICYFKNLEFSAGVFSNNLGKFRDAETEHFSPHLMNLQHPIMYCCNMGKQVKILVANRFRTLCFSMYERLPDSTSIVPEIPLSDYLSVKLPKRGRRRLNLKLFNSASLNYGKLIAGNESFEKHEKSYVLSIIRQMMETIFGFQIQRIDEINGDNIGQIKTSLTLFEYQAELKTWENFNISRIFRLHNNPGNKKLYWQPMYVYIICEICPKGKEVKLMVESEVHLCNFLRDNMKKLLTSMLSGTKKLEF